MPNFFNDPNADHAYDFMCAEELSRQKPKKKEKQKFDPVNNGADLIILIIALLFVGLPLILHYFG